MVGTTSSIVLNCAEAVTVNATEDAPVAFWIVVPPCTLSEGYKVTVENADGKTQEFTVNKVKTFVRNQYSTLKRELTIGQTIDPEVTISDNEIHYTATEQVTPNNRGVFGATYLADQSTYDSATQQGVLKFDGAVTTIGDNAFRLCKALTSLTIPEGVMTIGTSAFSDCSSLTSVTIPNSVTTIGELAFYRCYATSVYCKAVTPPRLQGNAFGRYMEPVTPVKANSRL